MPDRHGPHRLGAVSWRETWIGLVSTADAVSPVVNATHWLSGKQMPGGILYQPSLPLRP